MQTPGGSQDADPSRDPARLMRADPTRIRALASDVEAEGDTDLAARLREVADDLVRCDATAHADEPRGTDG